MVYLQKRPTILSILLTKATPYQHQTPSLDQCFFCRRSCGALYEYNPLQHTATHRNTPQHTTTHRNTPQHTATHRNTPQHTATHCNTLFLHTHVCVVSLLSYVQVCVCVLSVLCHVVWAQFVAVCCSVLQCVAVCCSVLQYVAVCCSVLQCVAVCCSVLQCTVSCSLMCSVSRVMCNLLFVLCVSIA